VIEYPRQESNQSGFTASNDDDTKSGHTGGHIVEVSDPFASIRLQLMDELQRSWQTFGRLDLATESRNKRNALGKLRDQLSHIMNELEGT